jgi:hypothetical protein
MGWDLGMPHKVLAGENGRSPGFRWNGFAVLTEKYMQSPSLAVSALKLPGPFLLTTTKTIYLILLKRA